MTKEQLIDAAVEVVRERAAQALAGTTERGEYIEAYQVSSALEDSGLLPALPPSRDTAAREKARRSLDGKVKRLLDEAAAQPEPRILRFSSKDQPPEGYPRLDGAPRGLYGQAVGYTTPEVYEQACRAVAEARQRVEDERTEFAALIDRAQTLGLPQPVKARYSGPTSATYDLDGFRALVEFVEAKAAVA
jgi:hypothetical protein